MKKSIFVPTDMACIKNEALKLDFNLLKYDLYLQSVFYPVVMSIALKSN
jgi:hypothetical protein